MLSILLAEYRTSFRADGIAQRVGVGILRSLLGRTIGSLGAVLWLEERVRFLARPFLPCEI
jgi:hypothetical protein